MTRCGICQQEGHNRRTCPRVDSINILVPDIVPLPQQPVRPPRNAAVGIALAIPTSVYILTNPVLSGWIKIGYSAQLPIRLKIIHASVPMPYIVRHTKEFPSRKAAQRVEKKVHEIFKEHRGSTSKKCEFFRIDWKEAVRELEQIGDTFMEEHGLLQDK